MKSFVVRLFLSCNNQWSFVQIPDKIFNSDRESIKSTRIHAFFFSFPQVVAHARANNLRRASVSSSTRTSSTSSTSAPRTAPTRSASIRTSVSVGRRSRTNYRLKDANSICCRKEAKWSRPNIDNISDNYMDMYVIVACDFWDLPE